MGCQRGRACLWLQQELAELLPHGRVQRAQKGQSVDPEGRTSTTMESVGLRAATGHPAGNFAPREPRVRIEAALETGGSMDSRQTGNPERVALFERDFRQGHEGNRLHLGVFQL